VRHTKLNSEDDRSVLTLLREQTRVEHDAIERSLGLMSETLTRQAYRRTLERFYGFWRPLEQRFQQTVGLSGTGVDLASREKQARTPPLGGATVQHQAARDHDHEL